MNTIYPKIKQSILAKYDTKHVTCNDHDGSVTIHLQNNLPLRPKIVFFAHKDLYFIAFCEILSINQIEDQNMTAPEVLDDFEHVYSLLQKQSIVLKEYTLFGMKGYVVEGLNPQHYAVTETPTNALARKFGKNTRNYRLKLG